MSGLSFEASQPNNEKCNDELVAPESVVIDGLTNNVKDSKQEPFNVPSQYRAFHQSNLSYAVERTDVSDPRHPFQDF